MPGTNSDKTEDFGIDLSTTGAFAFLQPGSDSAYFLPIEIDYLEQRTDAKVLYEGITQPTADLTLRWLDEVLECLEDSPLVIHDRGPECMPNQFKRTSHQRGFQRRVSSCLWVEPSSTHVIIHSTMSPGTNSSWNLNTPMRTL